MLAALDHSVNLVDVRTRVQNPDRASVRWQPTTQPVTVKLQ